MIFINKNKFAVMSSISIWLFIWAWMKFVRWVYPLDISPDEVFRPYMNVTPESNVWLEVWQRWDVLHYQAIAARGYLAFDTAVFTPPLYPLLMKYFGLAVGNSLLGGLIVSVLFFIAGIVAFHQLAKFELNDDFLSKQSVLYLLLFPTSFFLFAPYTESLFMLGSVLCLFCLRKKDWMMAGAWGMLATASRLTGALIFIPATWCAWQAWKENKNWKVWLAPTLILLSAISFPLYTWLGLGQSVFAPFQAQSQRFHGGFQFPALNIIKAIQQVFAGNYVSTNVFDVIFIGIFLGLGILVWKQLPRMYGIYYWSFMILYLTRTADVYPLLSMARYVLALFPAFLILARLGFHPSAHRIIVYIFIFGLLFFSAQFAMWGWVG